MFAISFLTQISVIFSTFVPTGVFFGGAAKPASKIANPIYQNFLNEAGVVKPEKYYSMYDSFITREIELKRLSSENFPSDNVPKKFITKYNKAISQLISIDSNLENNGFECFQNIKHEFAYAFLNSNASSLSDLKKDHLDKFCLNFNYVCAVEKYELLKNLFYEADLGYFLNDNSVDMRVSQRFITYFLRRYNQFVEHEFVKAEKQLNGEVCEVVSTGSGNLDLESSTKEAAEVEYVDANDEFDLVYYNNQLELFRKIVASPIYKDLTTEFITQLLGELQKVYEESKGTVSDEDGETKDSISTLSVYYHVLKAALQKFKDISETSEEGTAAFLLRKSGGYFVNMPLPLKTISKTPLCLLLTEDAVSEDTLKSNLE